MSAPDQFPTKNMPVAEVLENLRQAEVNLAELLDTNLRPTEA